MALKKNEDEEEEEQGQTFGPGQKKTVACSRMSCYTNSVVTMRSNLPQYMLELNHPVNPGGSVPISICNLGLERS